MTRVLLLHSRSRASLLQSLALASLVACTPGGHTNEPATDQPRAGATPSAEPNDASTDATALLDAAAGVVVVAAVALPKVDCPAAGAWEEWLAWAGKRCVPAPNRELHCPSADAILTSCTGSPAGSQLPAIPREPLLQALRDHKKPQRAVGAMVFFAARGDEAAAPAVLAILPREDVDWAIMGAQCRRWARCVTSQRRRRSLRAFICLPTTAWTSWAWA